MPAACKLHEIKCGVGILLSHKLAPGIPSTGVSLLQPYGAKDAERLLRTQYQAPS